MPGFSPLGACKLSSRGRHRGAAPARPPSWATSEWYVPHIRIVTAGRGIYAYEETEDETAPVFYPGSAVPVTSCLSTRREGGRATAGTTRS